MFLIILVVVLNIIGMELIFYDSVLFLPSSTTQIMAGSLQIAAQSQANPTNAHMNALVNTGGGVGSVNLAAM